jgi:cell wall-associated NlpC family hydrolase
MTPTTTSATPPGVPRSHAVMARCWTDDPSVTVRRHGEPAGDSVVGRDRVTTDGRADCAGCVPAASDALGVAVDVPLTDGDAEGVGPHAASDSAAASTTAPTPTARLLLRPRHTPSTVAPVATCRVDHGRVPRLLRVAGVLAATAALLAGCAVASPSQGSGPQRTATLSPRAVAMALPAAVSGAPHPTVAPRPTAPPPGLPYVTHIAIPAGCLLVSPAIVGIKVYLVQKTLHLVGHKERYDAATAAAVRSFQSAHKLPVTGTVDATTWSALHTGYDFCVDRYTQQPTVSPVATARQRIEAMIAYASARVGTPYVWGGAGPMGFDCSGLALQGLYAGGVAIPGVSTDLHVQADFRTTQALYASKLLHVPFAQRRRGDLVLYGNPISHLAIYLGDNRILEAVRPAVRTATGVLVDGLPAQPYVLRPFPY